MPIGTELQFRYDLRWLSASVVQRIQQGTLANEEVIIAYADQSTPPAEDAGAIELIPIRRARVVSAVTPGKTVSLVFTLGKVVYASDLAAFNSEVANLSGNALPRWVNRQAQGVYCTQLNTPPPLS
jgi:hypothetical protein